MPMNGLEFLSAAKQKVATCNPTEAAGRVAAETDLLVIDVRMRGSSTVEIRKVRLARNNILSNQDVSAWAI
jgi:hypothetical protein